MMSLWHHQSLFPSRHHAGLFRKLDRAEPDVDLMWTFLILCGLNSDLGHARCRLTVCVAVLRSRTPVQNNSSSSLLSNCSQKLKKDHWCSGAFPPQLFVNKDFWLWAACPCLNGSSKMISRFNKHLKVLNVYWAACFQTRFLLHFVWTESFQRIRGSLLMASWWVWSPLKRATVNVTLTRWRKRSRDVGHVLTANHKAMRLKSDVRPFRRIKVVFIWLNQNNAKLKLPCFFFCGLHQQLLPAVSVGGNVWIS